MIALVWLLACTTAPDTVLTDAVTPTLHHMDRDNNGVVDASEYDAVSFLGRPFAQADSDGDGALSATELATIEEADDPAGLHPRRLGPAATARGAPESAADEQKRIEARTQVRLTLEALGAELPGGESMRGDEMRAAVDSGDLRTAESRVFLARLEAASTAAGLAFPPSLSAAALAKVPVVSSAPTEPPPPGGGPPGSAPPDRGSPCGPLNPGCRPPPPP